MLDDDDDDDVYVSDARNREIRVFASVVKLNLEPPWTGELLIGNC